MNHLALLSYSQGQIQTGMELPLGASTADLAADPGHGDQRADEQGFLVEELGQAGADLAFLGRKVASVAHKDLL
jgi:hypothetical protein